MMAIRSLTEFGCNLNQLSILKGQNELTLNRNPVPVCVNMWIGVPGYMRKFQIRCMNYIVMGSMNRK